MKQISLLPAALAVMLIATSCKPSRVWATKDKDDKKERKYEKEDRDDRYYDRDERYNRYEPAPPPPPAPRYLTRLVLSPSPGFTMQQYPDGRYYHRSQNGLLYWKGSDNRFYLDRNSISRVSFTEREYEEWKRYSPQGR